MVWHLISRVQITVAQYFTSNIDFEDKLSTEHLKTMTETEDNLLQRIFPK